MGAGADRCRERGRAAVALGDLPRHVGRRSGAPPAPSASARCATRHDNAYAVGVLPPTSGQAATTADIKDSILDAIGGTPLVRLSRLGAELTPQLVAKVEALNPGGSIKDRVAVALIDAAERDGHLRPGGTIVEPTSGNTGTGLAIVAAQRG